jgi:peptide/nickel transport system ATP-binding protein
MNAGTTDSPVIECRSVARRFRVGQGFAAPRRELRAVDGVSLGVQPGEVLAIVGESGCGKTTLARMMLGIIAPSDGEIRLDGAAIAGIDRKAIARRVQPVFQDPYASLNPRKTVAAIVSYPLAVHGIGGAEERRARAAEMIERVGLPRRLLHAYPSQLSGGQRQRVAIARALVMRPGIVICDEPTSALDVSVQAQILNLLQTLRAELALTYVLISHDLAVVEHLADRVAVMYLGRLVELGTTEQVFDRPRHPYTRALLSAVLTPDPALGLPDLGLGSGYPDPMNPPPGCRFHPRCPDVMDQCRTDPPAALDDGGALVECHLYGDDGGPG